MLAYAAGGIRVGRSFADVLVQVDRIELVVLAFLLSSCCLCTFASGEVGLTCNLLIRVRLECSRSDREG